MGSYCNNGVEHLQMQLLQGVVNDRKGVICRVKCVFLTGSCTAWQQGMIVMTCGENLQILLLPASCLIYSGPHCSSPWQTASTNKHSSCARHNSGLRPDANAGMESGLMQLHHGSLRSHL